MGRYREVHSEKDARKYARRYAATICWFLWAFCLLILIYTVGMQYSEYRHIKGATTVVAEYTRGKGFEHANYMDEDNHYHSFDITGMGAAHDGDSIVLYYKDDIDSALPRVGAATWIRSYVLFGLAFIYLSIRLIVIYKSNHNVYDANGFFSKLSVSPLIKFYMKEK